MNKINVYICKDNHQTVTIDRDEGVTPFIIRCQTCILSAKSSGYKCDQNQIPILEWIKPENDKHLREIVQAIAEADPMYTMPNEIEQLYKLYKDHCDKGSLISRRIEPGEYGPNFLG